MFSILRSVRVYKEIDMNYDYIPIRHAVRYDGYIYFLISTTKELYRIEEKSGRIQSLGIIPWGDYGRVDRYLSIVAYNDKVFLLPYYSDFMPVYSIERGTFKRVEIPDGRDGFLRCMAYAISGSSLFMFDNYGRIIKYDLNNDCVEKDIIIYEGIKDLIFDRNDDCFRQQTVIVDGNIYVPFCNINALLRVDVSDLDTEIIPLGEDHNGYSGICLMGDELWCSPRKLNGYITSCSLTDGYKMKHVLHSDDEGSFAGISSNDGRVRLYPGTLCKVFSDDESVEIQGDAHAFVNQDYTDNSILRFNRISRQMIVDQGEKEFAHYVINKDNLNSRIIERTTKGIIQEDDFSGLRELIKATCR